MRIAAQLLWPSIWLTLWLSTFVGAGELLAGRLVAQDPATTTPVPGSPASAPSVPDVVVLQNGDTLNGKIVSFAEGKLKFEHSAFGAIEIPLANIKDLRSAAPVDLLTTDGERLKRTITAVRDGALVLGGAAPDAPAAPTLTLSKLDQINPPERPPVTWTGSVAIGAFLSTGNTERRSANTAAVAVRESEQDRLTAKASWDYSEEQTAGVWNLTQRRTAGGLQYDYFLTKSRKSYVFATTQAEGDTRADIDLRFSVGAGYGYQWLDTDTISFATELGLSYFSEQYRSATPSNDYLAARAAYKFAWKITEGIDLLQDVTAFPSLEDSEDVFLTKDTRLKVSMTESMFSQLQWILDYDNTPSPGLDHADNRFLLSVGWNF
jgi:putative salt-induced outer membrane protein YdiY